MFQKMKKVGAVVSAGLLSAGAYAQATLPAGVQDAIDDNIGVVALVAAAMLAIPLGFLGHALVLRAIRKHG